MLRKAAAAACRAALSRASALRPAAALSSSSGSSSSSLGSGSGPCWLASAAARAPAWAPAHPAAAAAMAAAQPWWRAADRRALATQAGETKAAGEQAAAQQQPAAGGGEAPAADAGDEGAEPGASVDELLRQLGDKEAEVEAHAMEVAKWKDATLRAAAEMENLRARAARQSEADRKFATQALLKDLLDVADNLQRALQALPPDVAAAAASGEPPAGAAGPSPAAALHQLAVGVSMTDKALAKAMAKHGAERFSPAPGDEFDAHTMAALFTLPAPPGVARGRVAVVTKAGFRLAERVIRHAEVGVAA